MISHPETRDKHASEAAIERMWTQAIGITNRALARSGKDPVSGLPGTEWEVPGSGLAGSWGSNQFILTAAHVLEQATLGNLGFFAKSTGSLTHASECEVTLQDAYWSVSLEPNSAEILRCAWEDLAVITLNKPEALGPYVEFISVQQSWFDPEEAQMVHGLGYPTSGGVLLQTQRGPEIQKYVLLNPVGFSGEVLPAATGSNFARFHPESHYLMPFEPAQKGKHPRGISGAAAWIQSSDKQIVWTPNLIFAGIYTHSYREGAIVQVVKASVVRRFLQEIFGTATV